MRDARTPWRCVAAAFALNGILLGSWASRIPAFVDRLALDEQRLGVLLLAMGIGALVSFPLAGRLSDRLGAVRLTRGIAAAYLLSIVILGVSHSIWMLAAGLFAFGMFHGAMDVAMNSWASEVERHLKRSVMSSFHAMWSLGAGLGAAGGYVATTLDTSPGVQFGVVAVLSAAVFGPFLLAPWTSETRIAQSHDPVFALPRGALVLVGVMALAAGLGEGAAVDWSAVFLRDILYAPEAQATFGYAIFSITMVVMRLSVDRLIMRFGAVRVARVSGVLAAAGYALCATTGLLPVALIGFVLMGLGYAAVFPMAVSRAANDPEVPAGQAIASVATLAYGAMLLGPPLIGLVAHETTLRLPFMVIAGAALLITLCATALAPARVGRPT
ncbi:MFS transporter [Falsirhodobacter sp. 20TX0035]|uniref:MFS transporter n=1 Tax=Falsirhodobacter sp. 20TX0035 TaxID=3022019 RepID=UPI00232E25E2|nr:MFS transporter [Falsirhodobacter sp. 20TX0035]MDB6452731.1 MFS transporter [Falsirhodobacter sp. 20TX0035]